MLAMSVCSTLKIQCFDWRWINNSTYRMFQKIFKWQFIEFFSFYLIMNNILAYTLIFNLNWYDNQLKIKCIYSIPFNTRLMLISTITTNSANFQLALRSITRQWDLNGCVCIHINFIVLYPCCMRIFTRREEEGEVEEKNRHTNNNTYIHIIVFNRLLLYSRVKFAPPTKREKMQLVWIRIFLWYLYVFYEWIYYLHFTSWNSVNIVDYHYHKIL